MEDTEIQPLDRIYRLEENAEWKHLLYHLELIDGFGLLFVLTPEQAGAEVCRRALQRHLTEASRTLHCIRLRLNEPPGDLGDQLLLAATPKDVGAVWVSAPAAESAMREEPVRQLWRDAIAALNPRRNPLRRHLHAPLIFAGPMWLQEICREAAPDLWSVRDAIARIEPPDRDLSRDGQLQVGGEFSKEESPKASGDPEETRQAIARLNQRTVVESETANLELLKARLLHRLGKQLWQHYRWDEAEAALLEAEQIVERHHQSLDEQFELLFDLSHFLEARGDFARGESYARRAYEFANAHFGASGLRTLQSRNRLANVLDSQGKSSEAEQEHRAVLAIRERVLGAEHPDTLTSRRNLAIALYSQGKFSEAEQENRAVLAIRERVLGAEHLDTLTSRNNLAIALYSQGKFSEAEQEHRAVLAIRERVIGVEHPDIFQSCYNLALCLRYQDRLREALDFARRAENGDKRVHGEGHPDYRQALRQREKIEKALGQK